jgi:hypothetical protein
MTSSPAIAASMSRDNWVLAKWIVTCRTGKLCVVS